MKRNSSTTIISVVSLLISICFSGCKKDETDISENNGGKLLELINQLRHSGCNCGADYMPPVASLLLNRELEVAAKAHAQDMDQRNYLNHLSPEGTTPAERVEKTGYRGHFRAENIGRGYAHPEEILTAWKNSVSHCKAMMDGACTEAGIGFSRNYWEASFGYP
jgi:uncharacterized protein YkwD